MFWRSFDIRREIANPYLHLNENQNTTQHSSVNLESDYHSVLHRNYKEQKKAKDRIWFESFVLRP